MSGAARIIKTGAETRFLLFGFDSDTVAALRDLGAPPAVWLRKGHIAVGEEAKLRTRIINFGDIAQLTFDPVDPGSLNPDELQRASDSLREMFRRSADRKTTFAPAFSWTTHESRMRLMLHYYAALLDQERISHVVFSNIPHEPPALVLEALSQTRELQVIMATQSPFPNRFFLFGNLSELGVLSTASESTSPTLALPLKPTHPFYMRNVVRSSSWRFRWRQFKLTAHFIARLLLLPFTERRKFYKSMYKAYFITETAQLHTKRYTDKPDLEHNFIYFPLHLQPELTVDVMGGRYADQALVVETLSRAAPKEWLVYVKENPKQGAEVRNEVFFQRLHALPNVRLIRSDTDTFALISAARCVATCTGTAGWEALLMGKPAVAFGAAWWRKLPGAYEWKEGLDLEEVAGFRFDRPTLESAFHRLAATMKGGVVDPVYRQLVDDFNHRLNGQLIAKELSKALSNNHIQDTITS